MTSSTRQRMVDSTAHLLQERGYFGTGIRDILDRSAAPRGSMYFHFPGGKEQLAVEAVRQSGDGVRALLLGTFEDGELIYSGKVGTGFDAADFDTLARKFEPLERASAPFEEIPRAERKGAVWLEPRLVAQIAFMEWTPDGRLRHPSFLGLRSDKAAREVGREAEN